VYTASISVSVNGTTPQVFACSTSVCNGTFQAPAGGSVNFLFSAVDGSGTVLSSATVTQVIAANGTNAISLTLEGVVATAQLTLSPPGLSSAASGTATVSAIAYDADGDQITGTYFAPLTLGTSDTTGTVAVTTGTLASSTSTGAIAYTYSAATAFSENHVRVGQGSATETSAQHGTAFVVGRTFYTFTANSIVGFAPGATAPTRTISGLNFQSVSALACDGTNLYISDVNADTVYGFTPAATSPSVTYTDLVFDIGSVAAYGTPGNRAHVYVANSINYPYQVTGFQGATGGPPYAIPPNSGAFGAGTTSSTALEVDGSGNVYSAVGGNSAVGGYDVFSPSLATLATGQNNTSAYGSSQIAIDTTVSPPRIYTLDADINYDPQISEYDNYAATPTYVETDTDGGGIFVDQFGQVYTHTAAGFHVYPAGALRYGVSNVSYTIPGKSLAFDSAGYVYAVSATGAITVYNPQILQTYATFTGTYGSPGQPAYEFGTFCQ
jgi:hypothetical protein